MGRLHGDPAPASRPRRSRRGSSSGHAPSCQALAPCMHALLTLENLSAPAPTPNPTDSLQMAPVHEGCLLVRCGRKFGIPAISVVLGASYFQRLLVRGENRGRAKEKGRRRCKEVRRCVAQATCRGGGSRVVCCHIGVASCGQPATCHSREPLPLPPVPVATPRPHVPAGSLQRLLPPLQHGDSALEDRAERGAVVVGSTARRHSSWVPVAASACCHSVALLPLLLVPVPRELMRGLALTPRRPPSFIPHPPFPPVLLVPGDAAPRDQERAHPPVGLRDVRVHRAEGLGPGAAHGLAVRHAERRSGEARAVLAGGWAGVLPRSPARTVHAARDVLAGCE